MINLIKMFLLLLSLLAIEAALLISVESSEDRCDFVKDKTYQLDTSCYPSEWWWNSSL